MSVSTDPFFRSIYTTILTKMPTIPADVDTLAHNKRLFKLFSVVPSEEGTKINTNSLIAHTSYVVGATARLMKLFEGELPINPELAMTAAVWHDLGKIGVLDDNCIVKQAYFVENGGIYVRNSEVLQSHSEISALIYSRFSKNFSHDVYWAILNHHRSDNDMTESGILHPLSYLLHWADTFVRNFSMLGGTYYDRLGS